MDSEERSERLSIELDTSFDTLNFKQLYYFHAVATEGSIARAAKKLSVAPATISEQVKNLEKYLQVELFDRTSGTLRLNAHGRRIYEHTKVMFRAARRLVQEMSPSRVRDGFVLEIGLCPTISKAFTAERFLPLFRLERVAPRIRHGDYEYLIRDLVAGDLDIILTENKPAGLDERKISTRTLQESPLVCVAAPDLAARVESYPADLANVPFVHYPQGSRYRFEIDSYLLSRGIGPDVIAEVDDVVLMIAAALQGICVVAVPESAVISAVASGRLVQLGPVEGAQSIVYAQFHEVTPSKFVQHAVDILSARRTDDGR
jgi:LysR family transcriptional activator of nhaA